MKETIQQITCNGCGKKIEKAYIETKDTPFEGASYISKGSLSYIVSEQDYCSFECLVIDLAKTLKEPFSSVEKYRTINKNTGKTYEFDNIQEATNNLISRREEREEAEIELVAVLKI